MTQRALEIERRQQQQAEEEASAIRRREEERAEQLATQIRVRYEEKLKAAAHDHEAKLKASRVGKVVEEQPERLKAPSEVEVFDKEIEVAPGVSFAAVKLSNPRKGRMGWPLLIVMTFSMCSQNASAQPGSQSQYSLAPEVLRPWIYMSLYLTPLTIQATKVHPVSNVRGPPKLSQHLISGKKKLREVEKEIWRLTELRHPNLIRVYSAKLESCSSHPSGGDGMRLAILLEQAPPTTLRDVLQYCSDLKPDRARVSFVF